MTEWEWLGSGDPKAMLHALEVGDLTGATITIDGRQSSFKTFRPHPALTTDKLYAFCGACATYKGTKHSDVAGIILQKHPATQWARSWCESVSHTASGDVPQLLKAEFWRDLVGNPFRPLLIVPHDREARRDVVLQTWVAPTVVGLALRARDTLLGPTPCPQCVGRPAQITTWPPTQCRCQGTGKVHDMRLDPFHMSVVADALVEAGMPEEHGVARMLRGYRWGGHPLGAFEKLDPAQGRIKGWHVLDLLAGV